MIGLACINSLNAQTDNPKDTLPVQDPPPQKMALDPLDLEIGEMIFDETMTKVGRDFYEHFYTLWSNPTKTKHIRGIHPLYTLLDSERQEHMIIYKLVYL